MHRARGNNVRVYSVPAFELYAVVFSGILHIFGMQTRQYILRRAVRGGVRRSNVFNDGTVRHMARVRLDVRALRHTRALYPQV